MSKQSQRPGYFLFNGRRNIRGAIFESIHEPVQVVTYGKVTQTELAVCMLGRASKYPITNFVGEWTPIETGEEA